MEQHVAGCTKNVSDRRVTRIATLRPSSIFHSNGVSPTIGPSTIACVHSGSLSVPIAWIVYWRLAQHVATLSQVTLVPGWNISNSSATFSLGVETSIVLQVQKLGAMDSCCYESELFFTLRIFHRIWLYIERIDSILCGKHVNVEWIEFAPMACRSDLDLDLYDGVSGSIGPFVLDALALKFHTALRRVVKRSA